MISTPYRNNSVRNQALTLSRSRSQRFIALALALALSTATSILSSSEVKMATLFNIGDLSMENLLMLQSTVSAAIAIRNKAALIAPAKEPKAPKALKEPKAPKEDKPKEDKPKEDKPKEDKPKAPKAPGVAALWLSHIVKARSEAYELYKASSEKKQGVALLFAKEYRAKHADEYAAFEASYKESHPSPPTEVAAPVAPPKEVPVAPVVSTNPFDEVKPEVKAKKPWSPETKAAAAAKRAANKAAKAAAGGGSGAEDSTSE